MATTRLTVTEVNQNFSRARHALADGPVVITERGRPAFVLMTYEAFTARQGGKPSLLARIDVPGTEAIAFETPARERGFTPADLG
jgi:prevent-host-death family protein